MKTWCHPHSQKEYQTCLREVNNMTRNFKVRLCSASIFISLFVFFILGFYLEERGVEYPYAWSSISFSLVLLLPFILGLERIRISFPFIIVATYLILGFTLHAWHPWWALFFLIPIYYIVFPNDPLMKIGSKSKIGYRESDQFAFKDDDD